MTWRVRRVLASSGGDADTPPMLRDPTHRARWWQPLIGLLLLAPSASAPLSAQRALHWREIAVEATLRNDGRLRVQERQTIVFTGDWNGGERRFNLRARQRLQFIRIRRMETATGAVLPMLDGDLSRVDGYAFTDPATLRWRSRLPSDPPFSATEITYVLEYSLDNVLVRDGDGYLLDHDFAFPDRDGVIERFSARLTLDSAWQATAPLPERWQATNLPPGEGFVVRLPLRTDRADAPAGVTTGAPRPARYALAALFVGVVLVLGQRLARRERAQGRLDPPESAGDVDEQWLDEHVFAHLPEVVGAAWDNSTGAPEVAAVLARLESEGRLKSAVRRGGGIFRSPEMHLELLVDRDRIHGHERRLIDALFEPGERTTSTSSVRERYKSSGFDPASKIKKGVSALVAAMAPDRRGDKASPLPAMLLFLGGAAFLGLAAATRPDDALVILGGGGIALAWYIVTIGFAVTWRNRVHAVRETAFGFIVPIALLTTAILWVLVTGRTLAGALTLTGLIVLALSLVTSVLNQARSREGIERIAVRRRLARAREYFASELGREQPRLKDEWFPYFIAFGLGRNMDKWFRAFGPESGVPLAHDAGTRSFSSGSSGKSGGGWSGFGGGGAFSGGGASASWTAAATSMAAGVSAPGSSSGGGGGGGGGGSSGGGGGGGW